MSDNVFLKTVFEALEDEIDLMNFEKINRDYSTVDQEIHRIIEKLESLPETIETKEGTINIHKLLLELDELRNDKQGIIFDIAIKLGFSTALKLIFYSLTMN